MSDGRGPIERAMDEAVRQALGRTEPLPEGAEVEWVRKHDQGDVRLDLRPLLGLRWPDPDQAAPVVAALATSPVVRAATFVPPRAYLQVHLDDLHAMVLTAVDHPDGGYRPAPAGSEGTATVTFSDPNVNKPLHVGHLRNDVVGIAVARILEHQGWKVRRSELCSDWGLHICRAVVGYQLWGGDATPESAGVPGDVLVGDCYVQFHRESMKQIRGARSARPGPLLEDLAADLLRRLEEGDPELAELQGRLTGWVEDGIGEVYDRLGCEFEARFRESTNRAVGEALVTKGIDDGTCRRRTDGSVYIDLRGMGADEYAELTLLRPDGTHLVYTRAFGAVVERQQTHPADRVIDVLGADWALAYPAFLEALARLGEHWARDVELVFHGMVRTTDTRMRSRDGTVVSARELLDGAAAGMAARLGFPGDPVAYAQEDPVARALGVALAKHHLLATQRDREVVFDEAHLWSGGYPRFAAVLEAVVATDEALALGLDRQPARPGGAAPDGPEAAAWRRLLHAIDAFPRVAATTARDLDPSLVVRHLDEVCEAAAAARRLHELGPAWAAVATVIDGDLALLGIDLPAVARWRPEPEGRPPLQVDHGPDGGAASAAAPTKGNAP